MDLLSQYLDENLITFLNTTSRRKALTEMAIVAKKEHYVADVDTFLNVVYQREAVVSTGIGMGIAIPHARMPSYRRFFIIIGICSEGICWDAIDKLPVKIIFLVGGPSNHQKEYLTLLSNLAEAVSSDRRRKMLLTLSERRQINEIFT